MLTLSQESLQNALAVAARLARKDPFVEFSCLRLQSEGNGHLSLTGANRNSGLALITPAKTEGMVLDTLVPATVLNDLVRTISAGEMVGLDYVGESHKLILKYPRNCSQITTLSVANPAEHHTPPVVEAAETTLTLSAEMLRMIIPQVVFAAATDETRPMLMCAKLSVKDDRQARLIAADGFHLSIREFMVETLAGAPLERLIPAQILQDLLWMLSLESEDDLVTIAFTADRKFVANYGGATLWGTTEPGAEKYPDFSKAMPQHSPLASAYVTQREIMRGLKTAEVYSRLGTGAVDMQFRPGNLFALYAHSATSGDGHPVLDCRTEGDEGDIWVDVRRFKTATQQMPAGDLVIRYYGPAKPVFLELQTENGPSPYTYILQAMQVDLKAPEPKAIPVAAASVGATAESSMIIDPALLDLALQTYSADKIAGEGKIKKPFSVKGQLFVCVGMLGDSEATCQGLVRADQHLGPTHTDVREGYAGLLAKNGKTQYVLTGSVLTLRRADVLSVAA